MGSGELGKLRHHVLDGSLSLPLRRCLLDGFHPVDELLKVLGLYNGIYVFLLVHELYLEELRDCVHDLIV